MAGTKVKVPNAWQRAGAGRYRSGDERFEIEQADGRWFVRDEAERDELGLPRTFGPFATLEAARDEAARVRDAPTAVSPLAARLQAERAAGGARDAAGPRRGPVAAKASRKSPGPAVPAPPALQPPPQPSWLDRLDEGSAARARRAIAELERHGFEDAERLVRTDATTDVPAIAGAILARLIASAALARWHADTPLAEAFRDAPAAVRAAAERAERAGLDASDLAAIASFVALTAVGAAVESASGLERDPGLPRDLAGWALLERRNDAGPPRRVRLGRRDLQEAEARRPMHGSPPARPPK